jgi:hypothetical protein
MYRLKEDSSNGLHIVTPKGDVEKIHVFHCAETIEELSQDVAQCYAIAEECTNFARIHLVTDFSMGEAAEQVWDYLQEKESAEEFHLIHVFEVEL